MHRAVALLGLPVAAVLAAYDGRLVVVAAAVVVAAQLPARWRRRGRPVPRGWVSLAGAAVLIAAGSMPALRETTVGSAAWVLGAGMPLLAPVVTSGRARAHLARVAGAATLGAAAAGALSGAILAGLLPGPLSPPAVVAVALLITAARTASISARVAMDGGGVGERWTRNGALLLALQATLATAGPATGLARAAAATAAAGLIAWGVAASDPRPLHGVLAPRRAAGDGPGAGTTLVAAGALLLPVILAIAAARIGALPAAMVVAVCAPVLPAIAHLVLLVRDRVSHAEAAAHDALTGLPSEPLLADRLGRAVARARRDGEQVAIAFLDLDGFKAVNDRYGHDVGDVLLREVADRLTGNVRDGDTVARRSGDEFLLLLPGVAGRAGVEHVARRVAEALRAPIEVGARRLEVGASIGLALWPDDAVDEAELLRQADAAMYLAKAATSGERLRWCTAAATARSRVTARLRGELEAATADGRLEATTQDVISLLDQEIVGRHVRPRWPHPRLGALTPAAFLPLLVDPLVARRFDQVVLELAVAAAGRDARTLTVPLTAASLTDADLPRVIASAIASNGRPHGALHVAVHASDVRRGGAELQRVANRLDDLGVRLIVTGLGSECLSWRDLAGLPLAGLEVGAETVRDHRRASSRAVLRAVAATGAAWDVDVVAAGVDTPDALDAVIAAGCTEARGRAVTRAVAERRGIELPAIGSSAGTMDGTVCALVGGAGELPAGELDDLLRQLELTS